MRFRHVAPTLALAAMALVVACSGDDDELPAPSGSSSGSGTSSGASSGSVSSSASSSSGYPGIENVIAIKVTSDWCYRPQNQCLDAQTFLVDFTSLTVIVSTCIETAGSGATDAGIVDGGADGGTDFGGGTRASTTSHAITAESVTKLKNLLNAMQTTETSSYDAGAYVTPLKAIEVTSKYPTGVGSVSYVTPDTTCLQYPTVQSGWDALYDVVRAL